MARKDSILLLVPAIIGGITLLGVALLCIQLANFQKTYFREVGDETKRNNFFLIRACKELLESGDRDAIRRLFHNYGPNPMIVKMIARGKGVLVETENVPPDLAEHVRSREVKDLFRENRKEEVLVKFDRSLGAFMVYHSARFKIGEQEYILVMASKCNSMTMLMQQTRQGILVLTVLGGLIILLLVAYFCYWIRSPLNRLLASMSKIAAGELDYPIDIPRSGLVNEIAVCLSRLTERLKHQIVSLRDDANEREAILNALTEAILLVDASGRVECWNQTCCELFFPGENCVGAVTLDCPEELRDVVGKLGNAGLYSEEMRLQRGERDFYLLINAVAFVRGEGRYFLITATDLSEIRKLEACRSEFIAAISHEMKTPLTGIIGAVDAINGGALDHPEFRTRCVETLNRQSERLRVLLQNFLTLTSLENLPGSAGHDFLPVFSAALLRSALELGKSAAEPAGIKLSIVHCDTVEFPGDALLLQQALSNLVLNAILHSGTPRVELSARVREREVDFCVRDFGCGIAAGHLERIFERFYRVPSGTKPVNGSGIGLAIVKHIARYHHGRVCVASELGTGTEFHLILPL